jgi:hypothetical protein
MVPQTNHNQKKKKKYKIRGKIKRRRGRRRGKERKKAEMQGERTLYRKGDKLHVLMVCLSSPTVLRQD